MAKLIQDINSNQIGTLKLEPKKASKGRSLGVINPKLLMYHKNLYDHEELQDSEMISLQSERNVKPSKNKYINIFIDKLFKERNKRLIIPTMHSIINDKASNHNVMTRMNSTLYIDWKCIDRFKSKFSKCGKRFAHLLKKIPLLYPEQRFKILWDFSAFCARLYFLYLIPIDLAFIDKQFLFSVYFGSTQTMLFIVVFDILINLNTAHYECGQVVVSRKRIFQKSISRAYGFEWLSTLQLLIYCLIAYVDGIHLDLKQNTYYISLLMFLVHHNNLSDVVTYYEEGLNLSKRVSSFLELFKLVILLFYILHIFTCLWVWAGFYSMEIYGDSWMARSNVVEATWQVQYLQAFYYSTVTMFTVGYGDVTPVNSYEKIISIIIILISSIQLPYSVNTVGGIITQISEYGKQKKNNLRVINGYMKDKKIPNNLQLKIREYLTYFWQSQNTELVEYQKTIINQLSDSLKEQLLFEVNQSLLNNCPIFKNKFSQSLKQQLVKKVRSLTKSPGQSLNLDNPKDPCLIFIEEGSVEVCIHGDQDQKIREAGQGQTLGMYHFITGVDTKEKYKSKDFSKLTILGRNEFLQILKDYPQDYEIFCQMRDTLQFNPQKSLYKDICSCCETLQHSLGECPFLHYVPDRERIIKQFQYSGYQHRVHEYQRLGNKKYRRFVDIEHMQRKTFIIQNEHSEYANCYKINMIEGLADEDRPKVIRKSKQLHTVQNVLFKGPDKKQEFFQNKQLLVKFQRIVKKILSINKVYPKFLIQTFKILDQKKRLYFTVNYQINILYQRMNALNLMPKQNASLIKDVQYLILKLSPKQYIDDENFEIARKYKNFYPKQNVWSRQDIQASRETDRLSLIEKYLPYLLYPAAVINYLKLENFSINKMLNQVKRRNNILII